MALQKLDVFLLKRFSSVMFSLPDPYFIRPYGTSLMIHDTGDKSPAYYRISLSGSSHKSDS
jgi:20S proteasome alpha/beta subunit